MPQNKFTLLKILVRLYKATKIVVTNIFNFINKGEKKKKDCILWLILNNKFYLHFKNDC